jgi:hypothetical protein
VGIRPDLQAFDLFQDLFRRFGIVPEPRRNRLIFFVFDQGQLVIDVKGTSSAHFSALASPSVVLQS